MNVIVPDAHGDWFNQRDDSFSHFMRLDGKKAKEPAIFKNFSLGVATGRDAWCYNFSKNKLSHNIQRLIDNYEKARLKSLESENFVLTRNPTEISWNSNLEQRLKKNAKIKFENSALCKSFYRPFIPSNLYFHVDLVARRYQLASIFPNNSIENLTICSSGVDNLVICINQNAKDAGQIALRQITLLICTSMVTLNVFRVGFPANNLRQQKTHSTSANRVRCRAASLWRHCRTSRLHIRANRSPKMISFTISTASFILRITERATPTI